MRNPKRKHVLAFVLVVLIFCLWFWPDRPDLTAGGFNLQLRCDAEFPKDLLLGWKDGHLTSSDGWETSYPLSRNGWIIIPDYPHKSIPLSPGLNTVWVNREANIMTLFLYDVNYLLYGVKELTVSKSENIELEYGDFKIRYDIE